MVTGMIRNNRIYFNSVLTDQQRSMEKMKYIVKWINLSNPANKGNLGKACGGSRDKATMQPT
jgi:hypothetical protein